MPAKNRLTRNVMICYFPMIVLFVAIRIMSHYKLFSFLGTVGSYILNAAIQILIMFTIPIFLFSALHKRKVRETFSFYGYKKISFKAILIAIIIGIIVYILNVFIASFFSSILQAIGYKKTTEGIVSNYPIWLLFINLLTTAVLPAICEETAHRGMLLKGFSPIGRFAAIMISSTLFGLMHLNIEQVFYAMAIGLVAGYISVLCDSIYPAMIIHFVNNAIAVLMGFSASRNLGFDFIFTFISNNLQTSPILGILFVFFFIATLVIALIFLVKLLFRETTMKNLGKLQEELFKEIAKEQYLQDLEDTSNGEIKENNGEVKISFEKFDELYKSKTEDLGQTTKLENEVLNDKPYKMDFVTRILLIAGYVLTTAVTICTLIWGLLW